MIGAARAREQLEILASTPRPAGGHAETAARAHCARVLSSAGFDVREEPFEYSALPGRWATAAGGVISTSLIVAAAVLGAEGRPLRAAATLAVGVVVLAAAAFWMARVGVVDVRLMRRRGVNLTATRGVAPTVWLVAHLDSKSQPVPILVRAGAVVLHAATWVAALALCAAQGLAGSSTAAWPTVGALAIVTGVPIIGSVVGARSAGAVDNASGVATVLLTAAALPATPGLGVLITSAEELGLAGARAWVRSRAPGTALNCDGIDDAGDFLCMYSGRRPNALIQSFRRAARTAATPLRVRRLLPGVLVDGVAFADAGWNVLTLSRGTLGTLSRIHTQRDSLDMLSGSGVDAAVPVLTRVAQELC